MSPSEHIDKQIESYPDWRGKVMAKLRQLIHQADPEIAEEWKWDTAVYVHGGMVCAVSGFKDHVKINFFKGVELKDKHTLINAGLDSKKHRAIDFNEQSKVPEKEIIDLIREAVALNLNKK